MNEEIVQLGLMDDETIAIDKAALVLAALDHPGVDLDRYLTVLNRMASQLFAHREAATSAYDQAVLLASVIAGEHDFHGAAENYDDPANADLIAVMDNKRGMPIALSIIYIALARRVGWIAVALNTPGHLLVRIGNPPASVVIDPFNDGAIISRQAIAELLERFGTPPSAQPTVAVLSNQATLVRLLLNQATRARSAGQDERALVLYQRMTTVAPLMSHLWWDRAAVERHIGRVADARASLNAMLETTRDVEVRAQVQAALQSLARSIH